MILQDHLWKTMNNPPKIEVAVYMADQDAQKFMLFQQYYDLFSLLLDRGVFNQSNCAISLHFDKNGDLQVIQRADYLYSKKNELSPEK